MRQVAGQAMFATYDNTPISLYVLTYLKSYQEFFYSLKKTSIVKILKQERIFSAINHRKKLQENLKLINTLSLSTPDRQIFYLNHPLTRKKSVIVISDYTHVCNVQDL